MRIHRCRGWTRWREDVVLATDPKEVQIGYCRARSGRIHVGPHDQNGLGTENLIQIENCESE